MEEQAYEANARKREEVEQREARAAEEGVCEMCGQRFVKRTRKRPEPGKEWRGILARFKSKGVCPRCYHDRLDKGDEAAWSDQEWRSYLEDALAKVSTSQDAEKVLHQIPSASFPDIYERSERLQRKLTGEEHRAQEEARAKQEREREQKAERERIEQTLREKEAAEREALRQKEAAEQEALRQKEAAEREALRLHTSAAILGAATVEDAAAARRFAGERGWPDLATLLSPLEQELKDRTEAALSAQREECKREEAAAREKHRVKEEQRREREAKAVLDDRRQNRTRIVQLAAAAALFIVASVFGYGWLDFSKEYAHTTRWTVQLSIGIDSSALAEILKSGGFEAGVVLRKAIPRDPRTKSTWVLWVNKDGVMTAEVRDLLTARLGQAAVLGMDLEPTTVGEHFRHAAWPFLKWFL